MVRVLRLAAGEQDKFDLLYSAFLSGGNVAHPSGSRTREERAAEGTILKRLKGISAEGRNQNTAQQTGLRDLDARGGTIVLEQPLYERLVDYVIKAPFSTSVSDRHADLTDWLKAAPEQDAEPA
jgi:hypothetical protein